MWYVSMHGALIHKWAILFDPEALACSSWSPVPGASVIPLAFEFSQPRF